MTIAVEIPSDKIEYNSLPPIQKIQTSHNGKLEVQKVKVYNSKENKLMDGNFLLRYRKIEPGKTTFTVDKSTANFNHKTQSNDLNYISAVIRNNCKFANSIVATKLDFNGNYLPDSAVDFAGYEYTITYTLHRGTAMGVLPEVIFSIPTTFTPIGNAVQTQNADAPITGGSFKLQVGGEFIKYRYLNYPETEVLPYNMKASEIAA